MSNPCEDVVLKASDFASDAPELLQDPEAWSSGYDRGLAAAKVALLLLPEAYATRTRDQGRGFAFAIDLLVAEIDRLQGDPR